MNRQLLGIIVLFYIKINKDHVHPSALCNMLLYHNLQTAKGIYIV